MFPGRQNVNRSSTGGGADNNGGRQGSLQPPAITLPTGGGALRGIDERFSVNPAAGTSSLSIPIVASAGRSGFSPQLSLSYDSGSGNGPFGFGWRLSLAEISRATAKGLPTYGDVDDSDVFTISGADDLVPVFRKGADGEWVRNANGKLELHEDERNGYRIRRYRPRIEGLFSRIERWTDLNTSDIHWRSISRENVTSVYGGSNNSRVFEPGDPHPAAPNRIFSWLICERFDAKGNAIHYEYQEEDGENVDPMLPQEKHRLSGTGFAQRYVKRIKYGNRSPRQPGEDLYERPDNWWLFEIVFDYEQGHYEELWETPSDDPKFVTANISTTPSRTWPVRPDPFSTYRAGFEIRTYRLCKRILMFHRFPELGTPDYLVRATEFSYSQGEQSRVATFIHGVMQSGYVRQDDGTYLKKSLPPVQLSYTQSEIDEEVRSVDPGSLENLPQGLDNSRYQWADLDGEGVSGVLTEQASAWFFKPNLGGGNFGPLSAAASRPSIAALAAGQQQLMDLAGDGQVDLVDLSAPAKGYYERTKQQDWKPFTAFETVPNVALDNPNLRLVDLTGDGHADALITEDTALTWYPSRGEGGFGPPHTVPKGIDDEAGPALVFADGTETIYLADFSGDGLPDIARIRNGEICYWPNLGYGKFGPKISMNNAPMFDFPDSFDQGRIRLADIDGTGVADIVYLGRDTISLWFNESGNSWSNATSIGHSLPTNSFVSVNVLDFKGTGTASIVWSSPLPGNERSPLRYIDLMKRKPHLLERVTNNLGAETKIHYSPSTKFYLADRESGKPWITRLPFPVQVVERVETFDWISKNLFVTRYEYHHGFYDGVEREFRGFGLVQQWDTEDYTSLKHSQSFPDAENVEATSHLPPIMTKTWFHTGVYLGRNRVSRFLAGLLDEKDTGEYYREPGLGDAEAAKGLLDDTLIPDGLSIEEEQQACRALKGTILRREVYALDGTAKAVHPYAVSERNSTIKHLQPMEHGRYGVFHVHPNETIDFQYERNPSDPRISHQINLEVDESGNVLKATAIGYGRKPANVPFSSPRDKRNQTETIVTYTENRFTNAVDDVAPDPSQIDDAYRTPLPCQGRIYQLTGFSPSGNNDRYVFSDFLKPDPDDSSSLLLDFTTEVPFEQNPSPGRCRRRIGERRTYYRRDDLSGVLPVGQLQSLALPGGSYKLAFTPGLLTDVYRRHREGQGSENLLPDPSSVLGNRGTGGGGYIDLETDGRWWIPSSRVFFHINPDAASPQELEEARTHFYVPRRFHDPFGHDGMVDYDIHDLLPVRTVDAVGNTIESGNDYRVLQPTLITDPNRNRSQVAFDALGIVVGTAVLGKTTDLIFTDADSLDGFEADLDKTTTRRHLDDPLGQADSTIDAHDVLNNASTRLIYDVHRYYDEGKANVLYAISRETHHANVAEGDRSKTQHSFVYADGLGREIQIKAQAEPGPVPLRNAEGEIAIDPDGQPQMTPYDASPRWIGGGWTMFNNKGKPVRQFDPFFTDSHRLETDIRIGVSPIRFYDPLERVIATLNPNHTYEKLIFDPWRQTTWDVNDTVALDPRTDADVMGYMARHLQSEPEPWKTWLEQRIDPNNPPEDLPNLSTHEAAAVRTLAHADTPRVAHFDALGRTFLTNEDNGADGSYETRVVFDIHGNERQVVDAMGRVCMQYGYDMLGNRVMQLSMDAGAQWMLNDVNGNPIRVWDSRGHAVREHYDELRRPTGAYVTGADEADPNREILYQRTVYGESHPDSITSTGHLNLRGRVYMLLDSAGVLFNTGQIPSTDEQEGYDFKGNILRNTRHLAGDYKVVADWTSLEPLLAVDPSAAFDINAIRSALTPLVESGSWANATHYDALDRAIQLIAPHGDQPGATLNVVQPRYNEAGLPERVDTWFAQNVEPQGLLEPNSGEQRAVENIDYDAKGQRTRIRYANGVTTTYRYERDTQRMLHSKTTRTSDSTTLQDLHYIYDPVGNITHIHDDAQQTQYFSNAVVAPHNDYHFDAVYRLTSAQGREHLGLTGGVWNPPAPSSHGDSPRVGLLHPGDGAAMGNYRETFEYDAVGNILNVDHRSGNMAQPTPDHWVRNYSYGEDSLIEGLAVKSNRLSATSTGQTSLSYSHDQHGNMTQMSHLPFMGWDFRDQLQVCQRQVLNHQNGVGERTYYVYDGAGQRVRKITERARPNGEPARRKSERLYLGGYEVYREYNGGGEVKSLERESLHLVDAQRTVAVVDTLIFDAGNGGLINTPSPVIRYQLSNHLGSASLELDKAGAVISYEEYFPYGGTSYQAGRSATEVSLKRYRYNGRERDEESGFDYYGARYYAPWLGRWAAADPSGLADGVNLYSYVNGNPIVFLDDGGERGEKFSLYAQRAIWAKELTGWQKRVSEINNTYKRGSEKWNKSMAYVRPRVNESRRRLAAIDQKLETVRLQEYATRINKRLFDEGAFGRLTLKPIKQPPKDIIIPKPVDPNTVQHSPKESIETNKQEISTLEDDLQAEQSRAYGEFRYEAPSGGTSLSKELRLKIARRKIALWALRQEGSNAWNTTVEREEFAAGDDKCNQFVCEAIDAAGVGGPRTAGRLGDNPSLANQWADPEFEIPGWRVLKPDETPEPGDVGAEKNPLGGEEAAGHVAVVVGKGLTAGTDHGEKIRVKNWGFRKHQKGSVVFRRYVGTD